MTPFGAPAHRIGTSAAGKRIHAAGVAFARQCATEHVDSRWGAEPVWTAAPSVAAARDFEPPRHVVEAVAKALDAKPTTRETLEEDAPYPSIDRIMRAVAAFYGVTKTDIVSARKTTKIFMPRMVAIYLARTLTPHSFPTIGRFVGRRHHTSIMMGVRKMEERLGKDAKLRGEVDTIIAQLARLR